MTQNVIPMKPENEEQKDYLINTEFEGVDTAKDTYSKCLL